MPFEDPHFSLMAMLGLALIGSLLLWLRKIRLVWILSITDALLLITLLYIGDNLASRSVAAEQDRLRTMLTSVVPTYATLMRQQGHSQIRPDTSADDPAYQRLIALQLQLLKDNSIVSDIYTVRPDADGRYRMIVDSETDYDRDGNYDEDHETRTEIGEVYEDDLAVFEEAFAGKVAFTSTPDTDRWGTWVTAAAPVFNDDGSIDAVVGVDYPAEDWISQSAQARETVEWMVFAFSTMLLGGHFTVMLMVRLLDVRSRIQRSLQIAKDAADLASRSKGQFLANMSHEIRTPMTAILGFCEVLRESPSQEARVDAIDTIQRNGEHLLTLINDILDLSKIEAGKMGVEILPVSVTEIVQQVRTLIGTRAAAKQLAFNVELAPDLPAIIHTDPTRLRQVLINLVGNAIKFTQIGGVTLRVHANSPLGDRTLLQFEVIDTGIGMTAEQVSRMFMPFEQADASTTRRFGGTGLGLAISANIARMLDGQIQAESTPGVGTTFRLLLNLKVGAAEKKAESVADALRIDSQRALPRVLVVDDAPDNRRLLDFLLRKCGVEAAFGENGAEAVEKVRGASGVNAFDLVLLDMQMPVMDGYTAAAAMRANGFTGRIIALTANAMSDDRLKCIAAGCDDYLPKPIDRARLTQLVDQTARRAA